MHKLRQLILGIMIVSFSSFALASEDRPLENHRGTRIVITTYGATMILAVIAILPSIMTDISADLLSPNPFTHLRVEARTLSWMIFGPGYWLWESSLRYLSQGAALLSDAGIGGAIMQPAYMDQFCGMQSVFHSAYNIVEHGPGAVDFLANYLPWMGYASLSGGIYAILFRGVDSLLNVFRQRTRRPALPSSEPQVPNRFGCILF